MCAQFCRSTAGIYSAGTTPAGPHEPGSHLEVLLLSGSESSLSLLEKMVFILNSFSLFKPQSLQDAMIYFLASLIDF